MNAYIDLYCERTAPGLWAEPLNALTNAAFFIAAYFAYALARREGTLEKRVWVLIALLCLIGAGSTAFHLLATKTAMLSDVLPILFYQIAFIWIYALGVMKTGWVKAAGLFAVFIVASALADRIPDSVMNGSLSYASAFAFLLGFGIWHRAHAVKERAILLIAAGVFALSLTCRSIDMALCGVFPIGTHFLWHCLNGAVLYMTTRSIIRSKT